MNERKEKFTPGPWIVGDSADNDIFCVDTAYDYAEISPNEICECWGEESDVSRTEMSHANAALIAAAPDMYAALEAYASESRCLDPIRTPLPNPEGYASKVECTPCGKCTFCRARAALAKARGES